MPSARSAPWQAPAAEVYLMLRAGLVLPVEEHNELLRDYLDAARAPKSGRCATIAASCSPACSASNRRSI